MYEVLIPIPSKELQDRSDNPGYVRQVLTLPNTSKVELVFEVPVGVPRRCYQQLLDIHVRRGYYASVDEGDCIQAIQRFANAGNPVREPGTDPLLWLSRVRWQIWKAALSLSNIQPRSLVHRASTLPKWPSASALSFRLLALWACRHWRIQREDRQLCQRLPREISYSRGPFSPGGFSDPSACYWFLWVSTASGISRATAFDFARATGLFRNPRKALSIRSVEPEYVSGSIPSEWRNIRQSDFNALTAIYCAATRTGVYN